MNRSTDRIKKTDIVTQSGRYAITVEREDLSALYPGMLRYTVRLTKGPETIAVYRTNSYEYTPLVPLDAEHVALHMADAWERQIRDDPEEFIANIPKPATTPSFHSADVVVIQGSPRADGNCAILAGWIAETVEQSGKIIQVIYPHDLDIKSCIGCYQCYNTGTCVFPDDMTEIISAVRHAGLLVICTPVYTNSVPGAVKLVIDRFQAFHAEQTLTALPDSVRHKGLVVSVAGRKGRTEFTCVTRVTRAFFRNIGFDPCGELLIDDMDRVTDVRRIPGMEEQLKNAVSAGLRGGEREK